MANLSFRHFALRGTYPSREKGIPTAAFGTDFNDRRTRTIDRRGYLDLKYEHTFSNDLGVLARASYDSYYYNGIYIYDGAGNKDSLRGEWWSGELQLSKTLWRTHKLTFGSEYRDNLRQDQLNYDRDHRVP